MERDFRRFLKDKGLKYTNERKVILEGVNTIKGHFDVDTLFDWIKKGENALSRATLYRSIPLFLEAGIIKEGVRKDGRTYYEMAFANEHHDHLICVACGRIIEFKDEKIESLQNAVCKEHKFHPVDHRLSIRGLCGKCWKKEKHND
ncbi:MAG: transcriptional repressor [Spirochaetales bacterium]|nr:transcriptional repressor [Spirochaetales bacterium]